MLKTNGDYQSEKKLKKYIQDKLKINSVDEELILLNMIDYMINNSSKDVSELKNYTNTLFDKKDDYDNSLLLFLTWYDEKWYHNNEKNVYLFQLSFLESIFDFQLKIDVNVVNKCQHTALHHLAHALGKVKDPKEQELIVNFCKLLIEKGANVNIQTKYDGNSEYQEYDFGNTPLHYAAKKNNLDLVRLLIEKGADSTLKNGKNECPMSEDINIKKLLWKSRIEKEIRDKNYLSLIELLSVNTTSYTDKEYLIDLKNKLIDKKDDFVELICDDNNLSSHANDSERNNLKLTEIALDSSTVLHQVLNEHRNIFSFWGGGGECKSIKKIREYQDKLKNASNFKSNPSDKLQQNF